MVTGGAPADVAATARMSHAIVHRGPDEHGVDAMGACALGHRRLRVVDLRHGQQPARSEDGAVMVVLNGEIYNFKTLRAELEERGHRIPGHGDTALIPHLYEEYGTGFVERLEGMFALALWDDARGRLVLARDRLGKKPLLHTRLPDGTFAFASELKALLQLPELRREVDLRALDAYLALQYVPGTATALRGVTKLAPGHFLVLERGGEPVVERYWAPEPRVPEGVGSRRDWLDAVRDTVTDAVRDRMVADVPIGALLSGGIDSSVVVALMAQLGREPVHTFSVGFAEAALRRAAVRPRRGGALRDGARGARPRAGHRRGAAPPRLDAGRAARRRGRAADVPRLGGGAPRRDGRARRRRRRRGVRRLRALRRGRARRPGAARPCRRRRAGGRRDAQRAAGAALDGGAGRAPPRASPRRLPASATGG